MENTWVDCDASPSSISSSEVSLPRNPRWATHSESAPSLSTGSETNLFGESDSASGGLAAIILPPKGYPLVVTPEMRRFGPPANWEGPRPAKDCELFCGLIPPKITETILIPKFENFGPLYEFRLHLNSGINNLGHAFVTYTEKRAAKEAVLQMDAYEIKPGQFLDVKICREKIRLYIGNIPKIKTRDELLWAFMRTVGDGLLDVITYNSPNERNNNRGFCFLEYGQHQDAIFAKNVLMTSGKKYWGCDVIADWADPVHEPEPEIMAKVKVLYVRNLSCQITENCLWELFSNSGRLERVKRMKDYAFVHFHSRSEAERALQRYDGYWIRGCLLEVQWSRPPLDKKDREAVLRARNKRMMIAMTMSETGGYVKSMPSKNSPMAGPAGSLLCSPNPFYGLPMNEGHGDIAWRSHNTDLYPNFSWTSHSCSDGSSMEPRRQMPTVHSYHNPMLMNGPMQYQEMCREQQNAYLAKVNMLMSQTYPLPQQQYEFDSGDLQESPRFNPRYQAPEPPVSPGFSGLANFRVFPGKSGEVPYEITTFGNRDKVRPHSTGHPLYPKLRPTSTDTQNMKSTPQQSRKQFGRCSKEEYDAMIAAESWRKEMDANSDNNWRNPNNRVPVLADVAKKNTKTSADIAGRECSTKPRDVSIAQSVSAPVTTCHNAPKGLP